MGNRTQHIISYKKASKLMDKIILKSENREKVITPMFTSVGYPDPNPLVSDMDPDPSLFP